jgi:hypothetical protein
MAMAVMFATISPFLVIYDHNQSKHKFAKIDKIEPLTLAWMLTIIQPPLDHTSPIFDLLFLCSHIACFGSNFSPFGIKSPKSVKLKRARKTSKS